MNQNVIKLKYKNTHRNILSYDEWKRINET